MHGHVYQTEFLADMAPFLGAYYVVLGLLNLVAAFQFRSRGGSAHGVRSRRWTLTATTIWTLVGMLFFAMAVIAMTGDARWMKLISLPLAFRNAVDGAMGPVVYSVGLFILLALFYWKRRFFVHPVVAWTMLNGALLFTGMSMTDPDFAAIVGKPDNVPIAGMILLLGWFTWLGARRAVRNDQRLARGLPPEEADESEHVLVWPDLVYIELICMVALTALLLVWSIVLKAPLEAPASVVQTPNPSKAPWYFLGLQEMLVYYDPWIAGVALPCLIIFGLIAIPYLDPNKQGNGYYTIDQRKFAYLTFQFGFLVLWIALIVMGTFMRGPNWNFYGLYETWDPDKAQVLNNVNLSEYFWVQFQGKPLPEAAPEASTMTRLKYIIWRESLGLILLGLYFMVIPPALAMFTSRFRSMYQRMGLMRYSIMSLLLLMMALLPIKMICRWAFNLKYFVWIPEYLLNV